MLPAMSLAVVGVHHPNRDKSNRQFEMLLCEPGDPVQLRPEPKNPRDANAIAVISERGVQLGYLTAERAPRIGQLLRQGREVRAMLQRTTPFGAWIRVAFDGEEPRLPEPEAGPPEEPDGGWFPDEVWTDE